ncbi:hypothetical protein [Lonepinella sp. BR2930]|uniref:hypothetical protein n=1 Tax=Lonepinella sp. BR2930 TaxID=3434554 RepID=UPI003F6E36F9
MDFSKLDTVKAAETTHKFAVLHPVTGEETGALIDVYSAESNPVRHYASTVLRKLQKQEFDNNRSRKPKFKDLDELQEDAIEACIVRIAGWQNVQWDSKELEFNEDNARKLLTACPWLREQVIEHSDNLANFLKA